MVEENTQEDFFIFICIIPGGFFSKNKNTVTKAKFTNKSKSKKSIFCNKQRVLGVIDLPPG